VLYSKRSEGRGGTLLERLALLESRGELNGEVGEICTAIRRSLCDGVYGRYLERARRDTDADRRGFYGKTIGAEKSS
jgi:hypothetical protein